MSNLVEFDFYDLIRSNATFLRPNANIYEAKFDLFKGKTLPSIGPIGT